MLKGNILKEAPCLNNKVTGYRTLDGEFFELPRLTHTLNWVCEISQHAHNFMAQKLCSAILMNIFHFMKDRSYHPHPKLYLLHRPVHHSHVSRKFTQLFGLKIK